MKLLNSLNLRKRDLAYFTVGFASIAMIALLRSGELVYLLTLLYFVATFLVTFRFVDSRDFKRANLVETPTLYYERESSLNFENIARGIILIISGLLFMNFITVWPIILIALWIINFVVLIASAFWFSQKGSLVAFGINRKFPKITISTALALIADLDKRDPKSLRAEDIKLNSVDKQKVLDLYLKLKREK